MARTTHAADAAPKAETTGLPDRARVIAIVEEVLNRHGRPWAWQGPTGAPAAWSRETGPKDLDVWCASATLPNDRRTGGEDPFGPVAELREALNAAYVTNASSSRRLRHRALAVETTTGLAVVDVTVGDLRIGPLLLVPDAEVESSPRTHRLSGVAAMADLLIRPILRGRVPSPARTAEARTAWTTTPVRDRYHLLDRLRSELGTGIVNRLTEALAGAVPDRDLPRRARRRLLVRSLLPDAIASTWAQRRDVVPVLGGGGPLGSRIRGAVVALVGTDGSGKSTVADRLDERLRSHGIRTRRAYFGMARGNLPGVNLARKLLKVPPADPGRQSTVDAPRHLGRPAARRVAAWYYAVEYGLRYLRHVAPHKWRKRVVIADRWVYDLRDSPWPGSAAARFVEWLVPAPDVLILADAPDEQIHARKPERAPREQAAQQDRFRALLREQPASYASLRVDTSGAPHEPDPLVAPVAAVLGAMHGARELPLR
jgi:thymidylate kinase